MGEHDPIQIEFLDGDNLRHLFSKDKCLADMIVELKKKVVSMGGGDGLVLGGWDRKMFGSGER